MKLPTIITQNPSAFAIAVAAHFVLFLALLFSNMNYSKPPKQQFKPATPAPQSILAQTVDLSEIKKEKQRLIDNKKKQAAELKRKEQHLKKIEDERYKKQKRINKLKAEAKKQAEEAKEKAKKRKAEEEKFKQEKQAREQQEQEILTQLKISYTNRIAARVHSKWRYSGAKDDWNCKVEILQDEGGNVQKVELRECHIDDKNKAESFKNAIKRAVNRASPLPSAPDKNVFDSKIIFHFKVNN